MTTARTTPRAERPTGWLDAGVVAAVVVAGLFAVLPAAQRPAASAVLAGALVLFLLVWFTAGRRALGGGPTWLVVLAVLLLTCAVGAAVTPAFATFQVAAFPIAWLTAPGMRSALAANVAVAAAVGVGYAVSASLLETLAVQGVSLAFSVVMGVWINRIAHQSAGRQALVEQLTAAQAQVAVLSHDAGAAAERERLARELHDTLTQSVTGIVMLAERARARHPEDGGLGVLEDAARQAMAEARALVAATAAVPLDGGLAAALRVLADRFRRETGLAVAVEVRADVPRDLEVVLLRCAQEALANVRKHAGAATVLLRVAAEGGRAVLTVADDGGGPGAGQGFGISGMRDRLALVAGDVALAAAPDGGSVLTVRVPAPEAVA